MDYRIVEARLVATQRQGDARNEHTPPHTHGYSRRLTVLIFVELWYSLGHDELTNMVHGFNDHPLKPEVSRERSTRLWVFV